MSTSPEESKQWKIATNDRYGKIVATVMSLATGSLLIPAFFLRELLGIPKEKSLVPFLNGYAYCGWLALALAIAFGLVYSWVSVKWVKAAWGQRTVFAESTLEAALECLFGSMLILFFVGVLLSGYFAVTFKGA
jgi:hypothetical protein